MRVPYRAMAGAVGLAAALSVLTGVGAAQAAVSGYRPTTTEQANSAAIPAAASNNFDGGGYGGHRGYGGQGGGAGSYGGSYGGRGRDYYGHRYYGHDPRQHEGGGWSSGN